MCGALVRYHCASQAVLCVERGPAALQPYGGRFAPGHKIGVYCRI
jgi:hypothetical protein